MKWLKRYSLLILFIAFIGTFTLLDLVSPTKAYSELENRPLKQAPTLSAKDFFASKFSSNYETYINDQFIGRDEWISLKSIAESFLGKTENNGILLGKEGYLFEKFNHYEETIIETNVKNLLKFAITSDVPFTLALVPSSYMIYSDKLPTDAPVINQNHLIDALYGALQSYYTSLDLRPTLNDHKEEDLYYHTDHHWTTYGAYLGYEDYVKSLGMNAVPLSDLTAVEVPDFYGTYFSKAKRFGTPSDTITYYPIEAEVTIDGKPASGLYDMSKWDTRDKYAAFLHGNNGLTVIKSEHNLYHQEGKTSRLLVLKDSFANSLIPFLTYNFDEIHVVDLRALTISLKDYMKTYEFDQVLILFNLINFVQDTNFARLQL